MWVETNHGVTYHDELARTPPPSFTPVVDRFRQLGNLAKGNFGNWEYQQLGDALTTHYFDRAVGGIMQYHLQLSAISRVDHARRVQHRNALLQRQPGSRHHQTTRPLGDRHGETGWHQRP